MKSQEYFSRLIPEKIFYSIKKDGENSYITLENVIGPLPINRTALEIMDLCDGNRDIYTIYTYMKKKYSGVDTKKLFHDVIQCVRNYEIIGALTIKVI